MTAILSAILLSSSLSSTQIDEFFTFPSWLPTSVSSANTPGSDPVSGYGWYVEEYTNALIRTGWTVKNANEETVDYPEPSWVLSSWAIEPASTALDPDVYLVFDRNQYPFNIPGTEDDEYLSWSMIYDCYITEEDYINNNPSSIQVPYHAIRKKEIVPVETGRKVPRSPRLTPDIQAGILSTFAAYCERQYYASQGQSNVWDEAQLGPRNNKKKFWFDPLNFGLEFDYQPTNRTITTRRLVDYENINGIASFIELLGHGSTSSDGGFMHKAYPRPGWIDGSASAFTAMYWSTTDNNVLEGDDIVPSLSWVSNPTTASLWAQCSQTLQCLDYDNIWYYSHYPNDVHNVPTKRMMDTLSFGQSGYNTDNCKPALVPVRMKELIETNFPHAYGWAITNVSRRLLSDSLCCANQVLSLMDRTYHVPDVTYPTAATNKTYKNKYTSVGSFTATGFTLDGASLTPTFPNSSGSFSSSVQSNSCETLSATATADGMHYRISDTSTSSSSYFYRTNNWHAAASDDIVQDILDGYGLDDAQYILNLRGMSGIVQDGSGYCGMIVGELINILGGVTNISYVYSSIPYDPPRSGYLVDFEYVRSYTHRRSVGYPSLLVTQPGFEGWSRIKKSKYGMVLGTHWKQVYNYPLECMEWNNINSHLGYLSATDSYTSRFGLLESIGDMAETASTRFTNLYGYHPDNYASIIPLDIGDVGRVEASVRLHCFINIGSTPYATQVTGTGKTIGRVVSYDATKTYDGYMYLIGDAIGGNATWISPSQQERDPLALDAKIGVITRTDWSWKTLKRSD